MSEDSNPFNSEICYSGAVLGYLHRSKFHSYSPYINSDPCLCKSTPLRKERYASHPNTVSKECGNVIRKIPAA